MASGNIPGALTCIKGWSLQKLNIKHLSVYTVILAIAVLFSGLDLSAFGYENFIRIFKKITFIVPLLFIISAFLAFKISETRIVLISLSFLVLSLSEQLIPILSNIAVTGRFAALDKLVAPELLREFFALLPLLFPFTISLVFLVPDRIAGKSTIILRIFLAILPVVLFMLQNHFEYQFFDKFRFGGYMLPWPGIVTALLPVAVAGLYKDRRFKTFSAALTYALIIIMMPGIFLRSGFPAELSVLLAGMILLHALYRVYWENSYIDELTGLHNRRALDEKLGRLRSRYVLSMVDVDHFKNFNDTYGHEEGDNVLRLVSRILFLNFGNCAYRYGGEEFCVVFSGTNVETAAEKMNRARADIEEHKFSIRSKTKKRKKADRKTTGKRVRKVSLTVSAGVAVPVKSTRDAAEVLKNADKALYKAKENGRNCVVINKSRT